MFVRMYMHMCAYVCTPLMWFILLFTPLIALNVSSLLSFSLLYCYCWASCYCCHNFFVIFRRFWLSPFRTVLQCLDMRLLHLFIKPTSLPNKLQEKTFTFDLYIYKISIARQKKYCTLILSNLVLAFCLMNRTLWRACTQTHTSLINLAKSQSKK